MTHLSTCSSKHDTSTRVSRLRGALLTVAACALFAFGATESAKSQCPTGWLPGSYTTTITICGLPFPVQVDFCYATSAVVPSRQYIITKITILAGTPPCNISGADLRLLAEQIIEENPAGYTCDQGTCPYIIPEWRTSYAPCWRNTFNPNTQLWEYVPCGGGGGCVDLFIVCCSEGGDGECNTADDKMEAYYNGSEQADQCGVGVPPECYPVCAPPDPPVVPDPSSPCF